MCKARESKCTLRIEKRIIDINNIGNLKEEGELCLIRKSLTVLNS